VQGPVEPRWWRRRRDLALTAAREAMSRAAAALVHLDGTQRSAAAHLDFIAGVDRGPTAARLQAQWQPVSAAADEAVARYLESVTRWDVQEDLELEQASDAAAAFTWHAGSMAEADHRIEEWAQRSHDDFVRVTRTLGELQAQRRVAEQLLTRVHDELRAAESEGLRARRPQELLAGALERFEVVEQGPERHSVPVLLHACEEAAGMAAQAREELRRIPEERAWVQQRRLSLRTRLSALEWRAQQGSEDVLRTLRREFVLACSEDLDDTAAAAGQALDRVRRALDETAAAAADDQQRWEDARGHLERARDSLDEAQALLDEPAARLALLRGVAGDPDAAAAHARFVLRDARQLLMSGAFEARQGRTLDSLAERLERVQDLRDRPHPDWLTYAHTLDAIVDGARGLVVDIRASRAR
jgi:chromosome segregation ATPase